MTPKAAIEIVSTKIRRGVLSFNLGEDCSPSDLDVVREHFKEADWNVLLLERYYTGVWLKLVAIDG